MKLISWNIQWARGVDGVVDPARIVADARQLGDFDVLCLQEVAAGFPSLPGSRGEDQFERFAVLLPGYHPAWAAGVDVLGDDGRRHRFGNMILSRYPIVRIVRHQLPWPADPQVRTMPRVLLDAVVDAPGGPLRVMTTHLEYHSDLQRARQVEAIRTVHADNCQRAIRGGVPVEAGSTYQPLAQPTRTILTGDFNFRPEDRLHARMQEPFAEPGVPRLVDAWHHLHGAQPHPHNVGLYDREQWPQAFTCDFIYASEDLLAAIDDFRVDGQTRSSDHQPQMLVFSEGQK